MVSGISGKNDLVGINHFTLLPLGLLKLKMEVDTLKNMKKKIHVQGHENKVCPNPQMVVVDDSPSLSLALPTVSSF